LIGHIKARENFAWTIVDVGERKTIFIDEILHIATAATPCDARDLNFAFKSFVCSLDRG
jgi:hypothetical protein